MKTKTINIILITGILSVLFNMPSMFANRDSILLEDKARVKNHIAISGQEPSVLVLTKLEHCSYKGDEVTDKTSLLSEKPQIDFHQLEGYLKIHFKLLGEKNRGEKYLYQVNGIQDNWIMLENKYLSVYQLPYGMHDILIKAVNEKGQEISNMITIPINVIKPFYLNSGFLFSFLGLFSALFFFIIYRNKKINQALIEQQNKIRDSIYAKRNFEPIGEEPLVEFYFKNMLNRLKLIYAEFSLHQVPPVTFINTVPPETLLEIDQNKLINALNTMIYRCFKVRKIPIILNCKKMENQIYILIEENQDNDLANNTPFTSKNLNTFFRPFSSNYDATINALEESILKLGGVMIKKDISSTNSFLISLPIKIEKKDLSVNFKNIEAVPAPENQQKEPNAVDIENHPTLVRSDLHTNLSVLSDKADMQLALQDLSWQEREWVKNVNELILDNLDNNQFNTEYLADLLNISRRQLHRKLKNTLGVSPKDYIKEKRLVQAKYYLDQRKFYKLKDVAHNVGFKEASYFTQLYVKRFGVNPSTYFRV